MNESATGAVPEVLREHRGRPCPDADLAGLRLLVTHGGRAGAALAEKIRDRGGRADVAPLIAAAPPDGGTAALERAFARWGRGDFDWLVVTSANGATALGDAAAGSEGSVVSPDPESPRAPGISRTPAAASPRGRVAAVGPATAAALVEHGLTPDLVPQREYSGRGLAESLLASLDPEPQRVLLAVSDLADTLIETALRNAGHMVERVTAYRTTPVAPAREITERVAAAGYDAILVMSGSAAREIARRFIPLPSATLLAAIGPPTALALADCGLRAEVVAEIHTGSGLLDALAARPRPAITPGETSS